MENLERTQFVVLTGHLDEQPLPDVIRRLRVQRKTGRLQVEYPDAPGAFFFEDGQMVDAQLGSLRGIEALYSALALPGASFNFNPLVRPPERNIDRQGQKFISDLVEGPRRGGLSEIRVEPVTREVAAADGPLPAHEPRQLPPAAAQLLAPMEVRLTAVEEAIVQTSRRFSRERMAYAVVIGFLGGLALIAFLNAVFDPFRAEPPAATAAAPAAPAQTREAAAPAARAPEANANIEAEPPPLPVPAAAAVIASRRTEEAASPRGAYVVQVLVEVRDGRVTDARVWNPRPGAGAYEAVALKMARERTYPANFTGGERLRIRVKP